MVFKRILYCIYTLFVIVPLYALQMFGISRVYTFLFVDRAAYDLYAVPLFFLIVFFPLIIMGLFRRAYHNTSFLPFVFDFVMALVRPIFGGICVLLSLVNIFFDVGYRPLEAPEYDDGFGTAFLNHVLCIFPEEADGFSLPDFGFGNANQSVKEKLMATLYQLLTLLVLLLQAAPIAGFVFIINDFEYPVLGVLIAIVLLIVWYFICCLGAWMKGLRVIAGDITIAGKNIYKTHETVDPNTLHRIHNAFVGPKKVKHKEYVKTTDDRTIPLPTLGFLVYLVLSGTMLIYVIQVLTLLCTAVLPRGFSYVAVTPKQVDMHEEENFSGTKLMYFFFGLAEG